MPEPYLRPQQVEMIDLVHDLPRRRSLAVEAPTGTGKSRAALVAAANGGGAIVATSTKALSHQYVGEIPLAAGRTGGTFKVLSGKRAMGCKCPSRTRRHSYSCPWPPHLEEARAADVVITNFALLAVAAMDFVDLGGRSTVIVDEAHDFAAPRDPEEQSREPDEDYTPWTPDAVSELLLLQDHRLVLVSATLSLSASHPHLADPYTLTSAGIPVHRTAVLPTPFDWDAQLSLAPYMCPDGDWATFAYSSAHHLCDGRGRLFITRSHREKHAVGDYLQANGYDVMLQADPKDSYPGQARAVARAFNERPGLSVVGTDTLMTGLDVPGDALGNIVVCGPPQLNGHWRNLDEMSLRLSRTGGTDNRRDYLVPNRAMRLCQAIGRGIRTTTDTANVVVGLHEPIDHEIYAAARARFS